MDAAPLADRMRPRFLDEFVGQEKVLGEGAPLRQAIDADRIPSMILWGPPGSGKTTLAQVIAGTTGAHFEFFSAVTSGIKEARKIIQEARDRRTVEGRATILFIDEIHRFNKAQQDAFLPHVEDGSIILIGATTENPSFEVNSALLSRTRVFVLEPLRDEQLVFILRRALEDDQRGLGAEAIQTEDAALKVLADAASGDARMALSHLEWVVGCHLDEGAEVLTEEFARKSLPARTYRYDRKGEEHYNLASALHKAIRGSDPQAALYWLARMLQSGEDRMFIARRLVRMAMEDVGLADPEALPLAVAAREAFHFLGSPEGDLALAQVSVYLATAPKSNTIYAALGKAMRAAEEFGSEPVPLSIRNAPTKLLKEIGYGKGYQYAHDDPDGFTPQEYLPEKLRGKSFYAPGRFGFEKEIQKRIDWWDKLRSRPR